MQSSKLLWSFVFLFSELVRCNPIEYKRSTSPTVTLSSGVVVGTTTQYPGATATNNKFLGIPYAQSPPLRFGLPQAALPWSSPLQATSYKPACFQQGLSSGAPTPYGQSEDCLYANIYTPPGATAGSNKTVMVWIYGGNLQNGDSSLPKLDGSSFAANQDVIIVTFNYRTNAFGFPNSPEIPVDEQNVGFYDQRFALQWIQDNIEAFGGNPSNVTIFGQSAGGYSVKYLLALPPSPLPYRAGIMESEATYIPGNGTGSWNILATALGCIGSDQLACMRAVDGLKIQSIVNASSLGFPPEQDGVTYVIEPLPLFANKQAAQVPVLIGTNGQESSIVPEVLGLNGDSLIQLTELLADFLPGIGSLLLSIEDATLPNNPVAYDLDVFMTDLTFQCPAAELAQILQNTSHPTWRYLYNASFVNTQEYAASDAYHTAEIPEVFGTYPRDGDTQLEIDLSTYMQTSWANFAKDPYSGPLWPEYGPSQNVANLGSNGIVEQTIPASTIDQLCPLFQTVLGTVTSVLSIDGNSSVAQALEQMLNQGY